MAAELPPRPSAADVADALDWATGGNADSTALGSDAITLAAEVLHLRAELAQRDDVIRSGMARNTALETELAKREFTGTEWGSAPDAGGDPEDIAKVTPAIARNLREKCHWVTFVRTAPGPWVVSS